MGKASRAKRDRRFERKHPKPFKHADIPGADAECGRPYDKTKVVRTNCAVCEMNVFLHCADCQIQITGCLCTAVERMNQADFAQFKEELAKRKAKEAGIILPFK